MERHCKRLQNSRRLIAVADRDCCRTRARRTGHSLEQYRLRVHSCRIWIMGLGVSLKLFNMSKDACLISGQYKLVRRGKIKVDLLLLNISERA